MITVIEQTTSERNEETRRLFHQIKPFLDMGMRYNQAFFEAGLLPKGRSCRKNRWSRDVVEYAVGQGYPKR